MSLNTQQTLSSPAWKSALRQNTKKTHTEEIMFARVQTV